MSFRWSLIAACILHIVLIFIPHLSLSHPRLYHHRKNTKLSRPSLSHHAIIMSWHWVKHTPSVAYTEYSIHRVQPTPKIVCRPFILSISRRPLNVASASGVPPYRSTATSLFSTRASKVKSPRHIPTVSTLTNRWIESQHLAHLPSTASRLTTSKYFSNLTRS